MNREEIIRMAREAGFTDSSFSRWSAHTDDIERFAELIVRECASVIQNAVDQRIPASKYVELLKQHFRDEAYT